MATIPMPTKAQLDAAQNRKREKEIELDIGKIDAALKNNNFPELRTLHINLDGKYQSAIADWGKGMNGFHRVHGFIYEQMGSESIRENLTLMRAKLEGFLFGWNATNRSSASSTNPDVNVTVNNTVNISVSFEEARQKIEDMTALSREQTDEILEKIEELEQISKETTSRKTKWEKVKPIIAFVMDKGADVAVAILTLIVQMKLGG